MNDATYEWQSIEGENFSFYPLYHKTSDLLSCNSYLFRFPKCCMVIDPGGTKQHFNEIYELLEENKIDGGLPVFIFITHCHFDHVKSLHITPTEILKQYCIGGHTAAAEILRNADVEQTISFLYTDKIPSIELNFELFSSAYETSVLKLSTPVQNRQIITIPGNYIIKAFNTPGHTPCSVCYQIGKLLFVGDLFFAHNPAVAGTFGWSKPDLCKSLDFLKSLIESERIERVFGGHGLELTSGKSVKIIDSILNQLPDFENLACLDFERFEFLKECTITFLKEIEYQIHAQNGRLMRVSGDLEMLGEVELAASINDPLLHDKLDSYLESFHQFLTEPNSVLLHSAIPMQGAQLMKLLQNMFDSMSVPPQLTLLYIERLQTLFKSHLTLVRGIDFSIFTERTNLTGIIRDCITLFSQHTLSNDRLFEIAESEEEFAIYLARRIDGHNRTVDIDYNVEKDQICMANSEHLKTLIGDVIESLVSGASRKINIIPIEDEELTGCRFISNPEWKMSNHKARFYHLLTSLLNGDFKQYDDGSFSFTFMSN
jgi:glyoxylase-like metal-dependent hydrolase (beta-lactamase superfamily II)